MREARAARASFGVEPSRPLRARGAPTDRLRRCHRGPFSSRSSSGRIVLPEAAKVDTPVTVNVDVLAPHGVTAGGPITRNFSPPATMSVRVKSTRRTERHANDTRRPRYTDHETAKVLGATRTGGGLSGVVGSDGDMVVVALDGISVALGTGRTDADGSGRREADGGPAEWPPSQPAKQRRSRVRITAARVMNFVLPVSLRPSGDGEASRRCSRREPSGSTATTLRGTSACRPWRTGARAV